MFLSPALLGSSSCGAVGLHPVGEDTAQPALQSTSSSCLLSLTEQPRSCCSLTKDLMNCLGVAATQKAAERVFMD